MNDPLIEQINIIKGYIKQARDALRFDEVPIDDLYNKHYTKLYFFLHNRLLRLSLIYVNYNRNITIDKIQLDDDKIIVYQV